MSELWKALLVEVECVWCGQIIACAENSSIYTTRQCNSCWWLSKVKKGK